MNPHPSAPYDEMDGPHSYPMDDVLDDEYGTAFNGSSGHVHRSVYTRTRTGYGVQVLTYVLPVRNPSAHFTVQSRSSRSGKRCALTALCSTTSLLQP